MENLPGRIVEHAEATPIRPPVRLRPRYLSACRMPDRARHRADTPCDQLLLGLSRGHQLRSRRLEARHRQRGFDGGERG